MLIRTEVAFRSSETAFFNESFIKRIVDQFQTCAFIWSFFLLVDTILEIRCKLILFDFFYS